MGILLLNAYGRLVPRRRVIEGEPRRARHPPRGDRRLRPDQQLPQHATSATGLPDFSAVTSLLSLVVGVRVLRRHRLRVRRDPVPDPAPGGPARGRPRPRVRRPEHARLGRELPADPHRRPDRRTGSARPPCPVLVAGFVGARRRRLDPSSAAACGRRRRRSRADVRGRDPIVTALGAELPRGRRTHGRRRGRHGEGARPDRPAGATVAAAGRSRRTARRRPDSDGTADDSRRRSRRDATERRRRPRRARLTVATGRGRVHRRDDQHAPRPGRRRQRPDARPARRSSPRCRASTRSPTSSRSTAAGRPASHFTFPALFELVVRDPRRRSTTRDRRRRRRPGHRHDRGDRVLLRPAPRRRRRRSS